MSRLKKLLIYFCMIALIIITAFISSASSQFKDVPTNHWANNAIQLMSENKIIEGYPDSTFKPDSIINRAELAKMMVIALNIPPKENPSPSFKDVPKNSWFFSSVESAKFYLTGFRTADGDYFRPSRPAAREDMAVAIVKALGMENETVDESILNKFSDSSSISSNLKKYVAIAIKNEIMKGSPKGESLVFQPQKSITRAEAAVLLGNVIEEGKVTYEEEKITYEKTTDSVNSVDNNEDANIKESETSIEEDDENEEYKKPEVTAAADGKNIIVKWKKIDDERLQGYKVVISKSNSAPKYPDDGYLFWITDKTITSAVIDNHTAYNNGDFGQYLTSGQSYYFSVTAYYNDIKIPGNAVCLKFPATESEINESSKYVKPKVSGVVDDTKIVLSWNQINHENFKGYKVVISKNNSAPKYPDDGYLFWITDKTITSAVVDNNCAYNGGDFGGYLEKGEKYYFSITAVYDDRKVPGNVISLTYPE